MGLIKCFEKAVGFSEDEIESYVEKSKEYQAQGLTEKQADRKVLEEIRNEIDNDINTFRKALKLKPIKRAEKDITQKEKEIRDKYVSYQPSKDKADKSDTKPITEAQKAKDNESAKSKGWDNAPQAINSINKRTGSEYKTYAEIPEYIKNFVSGVRTLVEKEKVDVKDAINSSYKYLTQAVKEGLITKEQADVLANDVASRSTPKRDAKGTLAEAVGETTQTDQANMSGEKVTMTKLEALKKQMRDKVAGLKEGLAKGRKDLSEYKKRVDSLNQQLRQYIKESGFTDAKIGKVLSLIGKVNTITNFNNAMLMLDKLIEKKELVDLLFDAKDLRGKIKRRLKSQKSNFGTKYKEASDFFSINPSKLLTKELLDKYIGIAKALNAPNVPDITKLSEMKELANYIQEQQDKKDSSEPKELDKEGEEKTLVQKITNNIKEINELEINSVDDIKRFRKSYRQLEKYIEELSKDDFDKGLEYLGTLEKLKEKFAKDAEGFTDELIANVETLKDELTLEDALLMYPEFEKDLRQLYTKVNPFELDVTELEALQSILEGLNSGIVNDRLYSLVNSFNTKQLSEEIKENIVEAIDIGEFGDKLGTQIKNFVLGKEFGNFKGKDIKVVVNAALKKYASQIDEFFGTGELFWNKIWNPIDRAYSQWTATTNNMRAEFEKGVKSLNKKERAIVAILMKQKDYIGNLTEARRNKLRSDAITYFEQTNQRQPSEEELAGIEVGINNWFYTMTKLIPTKSSDFDMTEPNKAYESVVKEGLINEDGSVNEGKYKKYIDHTRKTLNELTGISKYNTISNGKLWEELVDYFPSYTKPSISGVEEADLFKSLKDGDVYKFVSYASGSSNRRVDDSFMIDLDVVKQVNSAIKDITSEYFMKAPVNTALSAMKRAMTDPRISSQTNRRKTLRALYDSTEGRISSQFVSVYVNSLLLKSSAAIKLSQLADFFRPVKELVSSIPKAMIATGNIKLPYRIAQMAIQKSSAISESISGNKEHEGLMNKYSSAVQKISNAALELVDANNTMLSRYAKRMISLSEALVSPAVYYEEFTKEFKKQTGENFNSEKYNNDANYREYVDTYMDKIAPVLEKTMEDAVVVQSPINAPVVNSFGLNKNSAGAKMLSIVNPYVSVIAKERQMLFGGIKDLTNGEYKKGTAKIAAVYANSLIYSLIAQVTANASVYGLTSLISSLLGDDDDEYEVMLQQLRDSSVDNLEDMLNAENFAYQSVGSFFAAAFGEYSWFLRPMLSYVISESIKGDSFNNNLIAKQQLKNIVNKTQLAYVPNYDAGLTSWVSSMTGVLGTMYSTLEDINTLKNNENDEKKKLLKADENIFLAGKSAIAVGQAVTAMPFSQDVLRVFGKMKQAGSVDYLKNVILKVGIEEAAAKVSGDIKSAEKYNKRAKDFAISNFVKKRYPKMSEEKIIRIYDRYVSDLIEQYDSQDKIGDKIEKGLEKAAKKVEDNFNQIN